MGKQPGKANLRFPFLFGGTFIEGRDGWRTVEGQTANFPSFSEGLSLRELTDFMRGNMVKISLPFRRDFH